MTAFHPNPFCETDAILEPSVYAAETPARVYRFHPCETLEYSFELEKA